MPSNPQTAVKIPLKHLLPPATLESLIPPFEALFQLEGLLGICDMAGDHYYGAFPPSRNDTVAATIVVTGGTEIGVVYIADHVNDQRLEGALNYLALSLSQVASEISRRRQLADEVLERYEELNLIYDLGMLISRQLSQNEIVALVLEKTNQIIKAGAGVIYLFNDDHTELRPVTYFGKQADVNFWYGRTREFALSTLYAYEEAQISEGGNVICAPLRHGDERLGAIVLLHEDPDRQFIANDMNLLNALTHNTALFIQAARLYDSLMQRNQQLEQTLAELRSAREELSRNERLSIIGQTVSGLIHDMRNPLSIVMGYAGLLQDGGLTEDENREYATQIIQYVNVFSAMAEEVLDYTRSDEHLNIKTVALDAYLDTVENLLNPPGLKRRVDVIVRREAVRGYQVRIDAQRFARVFQNLVNNAVDAVEEHGGTHVIVEALPTRDSMIRFSIADDGPGVPPEMVEKIFEPFVTGKAHGTGLGLPIVSRMITRHGGSIHYETSPEGGACFVFTVPQA